MTLFRVQELERATSTNDVIKRAIEAGDAEGLAVCARMQTAGHGRQGRAWESPEGGLYCSVLLRPLLHPNVNATQLSTLSLVVAVAVRRALVAVCGSAFAHEVQLKWPNDVVLGAHVGKTCAGSARTEESRAQDVFAKDAPAPFQKLCGISLEQHAGALCVGMGINVLRPNKEKSPAGFAGQENIPARENNIYARENNISVGQKNIPAYVCDKCPRATVAQVRDAVLEALEAAYYKWLAGGFAPFLDEYNAHHMLAGRAISVVDANGATLAEGTVVGVDAQGRLLLESAAENQHGQVYQSGQVGQSNHADQNGHTLRAISSGEAHIKL